jgi:energy-coupling factor transporter ATP-binding protein EcfA2
MRLTSARLHPFGHFTDRTFDLARPLVVIHGPNQLGKTTLRQAIFHALFTPSKLTKSKFEDTVGTWLPLPTGDYAAVTLMFACAGTTWTLEKRWGAGQGSRLSDGTTSIGDPDAVQAKLGELLAHGEATYRHVLFTGQAELEGTLARIEAHAKDLRDIRDLLQAAAGAAADVDEQKLRRLLDDRIAKAFGRWDDDRGLPERQNGREKDLQDPWKRDVGQVLAAWYAWQTHEAARRDVLSLEAAIDRVGAEVANVEQGIRERDAFVGAYGGLRAGLAARRTLEERVKRLHGEKGVLQTDFAAWPTAQAAIDAWNMARPGHATDLATVQAELTAARTRQAGAATAAAFEAIEQARLKRDAARADAAAHRHPGEQVLAEIVRLEGAIKEATLKIEARTLAWRIEADTTRSATLTRGDQPPEPVTLGPAVSSGTAQGRMQVVVDGVTLTVTSGTDDVNALFESLAADKTSLANRVEACGATSSEDARDRAETHRRHATAAAHAEKLYAGLLQGKSYEDWLAAVRDIAALPATRDVQTLELQVDAKQKVLSDGDARIRSLQESVANWTSTHGDLASLGQTFAAVTGELATASAALEAAPALPDGYRSVDVFMNALEKAEQDRISARDTLTVKAAELNGLVERLGDRRSEDMAEEAGTAQRAFERARARGRDYLRIRAALDRIAAGGGADPLVAFAAKVADLFSRITGTVTSLGFAGQLPATVERSGVPMPYDRLSQGANGALALAVRLAMAEVYLDGGRGFVMLDDPLVHLDRDRMAEATAILRAFAERSQVIFFTCHDEHAARLEGPAAAAAGHAGRP